MKILAVALFVVAMAALTTADDEVSIQTPAPEDRVPRIILNKTTEPDGFLQSAVRQKRQTQASTNLKWVTWPGDIPDGSVVILNSYVKRYDYVCKSGCSAGFYSPSKGPYCHYAYGDKEIRVSQFEILVNEGNLENLLWKYGSYGSVPQNSVKTCSGSDVYVGRNKYGLGKVHTTHEAFFLPWKGNEYWYKKYEVLTYESGVYSERISNVRYNTYQEKILEYPPETLSKSSTTNHACRTVTKTVALQKTQQVEKRWDTSIAITLGVSTSITAGFPKLASGSIEYSAATTMQFSYGQTVTDSKSYAFSAEVTVPPNHSCTVRMVGKKFSSDVPFTALLTRTYDFGVTKSAHITGTYKGVDIVDVQTVVDRCTPIPNARPCLVIENGRGI